MSTHTPHDGHDHDQDHSKSEPHGHSHTADACCGSSAAPATQTVAPIAKPVIGTDGVQTPIRILQMDCPTEEGLLRKKLGGMAGVTGLEFNLMQRVLTVTHAPQAIEPILEAVRSLGFTPEIADGTSGNDAPAPETAKPWWPLALAGAAALTSEAVHWAGLPTWLAAALAWVAVGLSGITTYKKGWIAIRNGNLNINALMSIAVTGALLLGQWPEAAMVMVVNRVPIWMWRIGPVPLVPTCLWLVAK